MEDPIFEPWSAEEFPAPPTRWHPPRQHVEGDRAVRHTGTVDFLRAVSIPRLEVIGRRLRMARHETSLEDLLDGPDRLLRFELRPWPGPLAGLDLRPAAMLELGVDGESDDLVTAWYWLDRVGEAPDRVATVSSSKLSVPWIERVILDFVGKALERS